MTIMRAEFWTYCIAGKFGEDFNLAVWRIVKNRQIKFSANKILAHYVIRNTRAHPATRKLFALHVRVSSLSGKDIELVNKAVKRPLSGDLKPVTRSPRGKYNAYTQGHKLESMPLTTERQRPLCTSRSFWIVRSANPMSPLSSSVTKNFQQRCMLCAYDYCLT